MPDPVAKGTTTPSDDISNLTFDQIFGTGEEQTATASATSETQTTTTSATSATTTTQPQATVVEWKPIRTKTGTVYDTYEANVQGIEQKDTVIEQLRDRLKAITGQDPLKPQPVTSEQPNYLDDPTRFADDLADAAKKGDAGRYQKVFIRQMEEYLAPIRPLIQDYAQSRAKAQVSSEIKDFDTFVGSQDFTKTLERNPALANAISGASQYIRFSQQLPELYRLAYESYTARRVPELVQAAQTGAQTTPAATTASRSTTTTGTTLSTGAPVTTGTVQELMKTREGRAEIKRQFEASGGAEREFGTFRGW